MSLEEDINNIVKNGPLYFLVIHDSELDGEKGNVGAEIGPYTNIKITPLKDSKLVQQPEYAMRIHLTGLRIDGKLPMNTSSIYECQVMYIKSELGVIRMEGVLQAPLPLVFPNYGTDYSHKSFTANVDAVKIGSPGPSALVFSAPTE